MNKQPVNNWETGALPKVGDFITMAGDYERRTFWQWLTRQPRKMKRYRITAESRAWMMGGNGDQ